MLDEVPLEILQIVARFLGPSNSCHPNSRGCVIVWHKNIFNLSRVCKRLHVALLPLLYESIIISVAESRLAKLKLSPMITCFMEDGTTQPCNSFRFARELQIVAPNTSTTVEKVLTVQDESLSDDDSIGEFDWEGNQLAHDDLVEKLEEQLQSLSYLQDNMLRSFSYVFLQWPMDIWELTSSSWHLGCCIPGSIFGRSGLIATKQSSIQSLHLTTDGTCEFTDADFDGLRHLKSLQYLSWKGLNPSESHADLRNMLNANSGHLEALTLESFDDKEADLHITDFNDPKDISGFHSLRYLSLSHISLESAHGHISNKFNLERLLLLKLIQCPHTN